MLKNKLKFTVIILLMLGFASQSFAQEGQVTVEQDDDITTLLEFKKDLKTVDLFKIQVYSGTRSGAEVTRKEFLQSFNEWPVSMEFDSPNTKIWVGNFRSRLEADKALLKVKKKYEHAFIFKPKREKN